MRDRCYGRRLDANQHMRHSAYADIAAQARLNMLNRPGPYTRQNFLKHTT